MINQRKMNPEVDQYLQNGCGRCPLGGTPACKVNSWRKELELLRALALDCGLTEELKWRVPCYTYGQKNILVIAAFKEYAALSFFKGVFLSDSQGILEIPGENSQSVRLIKFTAIQQIKELEQTIKAYIFEAIEVEKAGLSAGSLTKPELVFPEELTKILQENPVLKAAFETLTPGRQRGYHLYFSAPAQSKTRKTRIEKCIPKILEGKGLYD